MITAQRRPSAVNDLHEDACVLDLVHLSRQTLGDIALETELLELFDRQAAGIVARLSGAAGARGSCGADIVHMLKGSARAVGAFAVAQAAERLEHTMRAGGAADADVASLAATVDAARRTVAAFLS